MFSTIRFQFGHPCRGAFGSLFRFGFGGASGVRSSVVFGVRFGFGSCIFGLWHGVCWFGSVGFGMFLGFWDKLSCGACGVFGACYSVVYGVCVVCGVGYSVVCGVCGAC